MVTPSGLEGGYTAIQKAIEIIEQNICLKTSVLGEPQLGKRGLYTTLSTKNNSHSVRMMMDLISYCDGNTNLLDIANLINKPFWELVPVMSQLIDKGLLFVEKSD